MKTLFTLVMIALLAGCACQKEDEEFAPFPGGKCCDEQPKA